MGILLNTADSAVTKLKGIIPPLLSSLMPFANTVQSSYLNSGFILDSSMLSALVYEHLYPCYLMGQDTSSSCFDILCLNPYLASAALPSLVHAGVGNKNLFYCAGGRQPNPNGLFLKKFSDLLFSTIKPFRIAYRWKY